MVNYLALCDKDLCDSCPILSEVCSCFWPKEFLTCDVCSRFFVQAILPQNIWAFLPHQVKTQYLHFRHANHFLLLWKIPEEISRRSMLFHN